MWKQEVASQYFVSLNFLGNLKVLGKNGKRFQVKGLFLYILCLQTIIYMYSYNMTLYGMAGRSISNIYDSRRHIYWGTKPWGKYTIKVVYIGYRLTSISCYIYYVYTTVSVQQRNLLPKSTSWNGTTFALKSISLIYIRRTTSKIYSWIYFE